MSEYTLSPNPEMAKFQELYLVPLTILFREHRIPHFFAVYKITGETEETFSVVGCNGGMVPEGRSPCVWASKAGVILGDKALIVSSLLGALQTDDLFKIDTKELGIDSMIDEMLNYARENDIYVAMEFVYELDEDKHWSRTVMHVDVEKAPPAVLCWSFISFITRGEVTEKVMQAVHTVLKLYVTEGPREAAEFISDMGQDVYQEIEREKDRLDIPLYPINEDETDDIINGVKRFLQDLE